VPNPAAKIIARITENLLGKLFNPVLLIRMK